MDKITAHLRMVGDILLEAEQGMLAAEEMAADYPSLTDILPDLHRLTVRITGAQAQAEGLRELVQYEYERVV